MCAAWLTSEVAREPCFFVADSEAPAEDTPTSIVRGAEANGGLVGIHPLHLGHAVFFCCLVERALVRPISPPLGPDSPTMTPSSHPVAGILLFFAVPCLNNKLSRNSIVTSSGRFAARRMWSLSAIMWQSLRVSAPVRRRVALSGHSSQSVAASLVHLPSSDFTHLARVHDSGCHERARGGDNCTIRSFTSEMLCKIVTCRQVLGTHIRKNICCKVPRDENDDFARRKIQHRSVCNRNEWT